MENRLDREMESAIYWDKHVMSPEGRCSCRGAVDMRSAYILSVSYLGVTQAGTVGPRLTTYTP